MSKTLIHKSATIYLFSLSNLAIDFVGGEQLIYPGHECDKLDCARFSAGFIKYFLGSDHPSCTIKCSLTRSGRLRENQQNKPKT